MQYRILFKHDFSLFISNKFIRLGSSFNMLKTKQLIEDYKRIGTLKTLSEADSDRLSKILAIAESDSVLADLICEADLEIAEELNLINEESIRHSEEVRIKLAERFGITYASSDDKNTILLIS